MDQGEQLVPSRGACLWTMTSGQGAPVLFCNGGPGCADYLGPVAALIDDRAQVIRYEPSGCGRSPANPPYDIDGFLDDIESIRQHYRIDKWFVAGHSFGADLAIMYALRHRAQVDGVLCISGGRFHNDRDWHRVYEERRCIEVLPTFASPPNMDVCGQVNRSAREYMKRPTLWKELSQLDVPALFVYGSEDIRPSWCVEQVANVLPNARFVLIDGADHHIWTTHADSLKSQLTHFVASLTADS